MIVTSKCFARPGAPLKIPTVSTMSDWRSYRRGLNNARTPEKITTTEAFFYFTEQLPPSPSSENVGFPAGRFVVYTDATS